MRSDRTAYCLKKVGEAPADWTDCGHIFNAALMKTDVQLTGPNFITVIVPCYTH